MLNKLISSIILCFSFAIMPASGKEPDSILFLFTSSNKWVGSLRLALALTLFFISFKTLSRLFANYPKLRKALLTTGLTMIVFGLVSTLEASLGTFVYDYLKPLDLMILLEAGIIVASVALTTQPTAITAVANTKNVRTSPKLVQETA